MTPPVSDDPGNIRPGPLRSDLQTSEQNQRGRRYTVIKSPLTLTYFRIPSEYYEAAKEFDGKRLLKEIAFQLRKSHAYWRTLHEEDAVSELHQLVLQLAGGGLLHLPGSSATARGRRLQQQSRKHRFEQAIGKVLYFRKSLHDPDKLLTRMLPWFSWIYTSAAGWCFLLLLFATGWMLFDNSQELTTQAVNFFTLENLFLSWVLFMGVKIIHEFGHGLTCKRYGGEVHEMGFLFILLTPYLYCDVSDSWMVASRARRVAVTAAGMIAELFLACTAAWLWYLLQPGLGRQLCFNTMFICSVSTILFNANPLMKFDGYYIVTDLLEIPNLRQKGNSVVSGFVSRIIGLPPARETVLEHEKSLLFGLYAVAAYIYGWWITFHIAAVVFDKLEPYGLGFLSRSYVGLFLFVSLALPLWRLIQGFRNTRTVITLPRRKLIWILSTIAGLILLLFIPWKGNVHSMCVVEFATREQVMPGEAGWLKQWFIHEGERVLPGQPIAQLENPILESSLEDTRLEKETEEVKWRAALNSPDESIRLAAAAWEKGAQEIGERLHGLQVEKTGLLVRATQPGVVVMPEMDQLLGQYFPKGRLLVQIGNDHDMCLVLPLNEKQAEQLKLGDSVFIRLKAYPDTQFRGHVLEVPTSSVENFSSPAMASQFGGEFPSEAGKKPGELPHPAIPCYEAVVSLDSFPEHLRSGMTGNARVVTRSSTLGGFLGEQLLDWLNPSLRL